MGTPHIGANIGDIAETILLPGDPLRAKLIAETYLTDVVQYNKVRNMFGYTGYYQGRRVSVQGTGMGIPSISIYVNELITTYGCQNLIRIGTAGSLRADVKVRDIVLGMSAAHDSAINNIRFRGMTYCPTADFTLLNNAYNAAMSKNLSVRVGQIMSADTFYNDDPEEYIIWANHGVMAVEMEAAGLYTLAAKHNRRALCICTISDSLVTHESMSADDRQNSLQQMIEIALESTKAL
ncbi:MAG: purine-nucleoside phosphorylase [Bacillota bacterium]